MKHSCLNCGGTFAHRKGRRNIFCSPKPGRPCTEYCGYQFHRRTEKSRQEKHRFENGRRAFIFGTASSIAATLICKATAHVANLLGGRPESVTGRDEQIAQELDVLDARVMARGFADGYERREMRRQALGILEVIGRQPSGSLEEQHFRARALRVVSDAGVEGVITPAGTAHCHAAAASALKIYENLHDHLNVADAALRLANVCHDAADDHAAAIHGRYAYDTLSERQLLSSEKGKVLFHQAAQLCLRYWDDERKYYDGLVSLERELHLPSVSAETSRELVSYFLKHGNRREAWRRVETMKVDEANLWRTGLYSRDDTGTFILGELEVLFLDHNHRGADALIQDRFLLHYNANPLDFCRRGIAALAVRYNFSLPALPAPQYSNPFLTLLPRN